MFLWNIASTYETTWCQKTIIWTHLIVPAWRVTVFHVRKAERKMFCEIRSTYGSNCEELECVAVQFDKGLLMFQGTYCWHLQGHWVNWASKWPLPSDCLISCLLNYSSYSLTLKMEALCSSETLGTFYKTTHHIPDINRLWNARFFSMVVIQMPF
jgi:hypothetical protein